MNRTEKLLSKFSTRACILRPNRAQGEIFFLFIAFLLLTLTLSLDLLAKNPEGSTHSPDHLADHFTNPLIDSIDPYELFSTADRPPLPRQQYEAVEVYRLAHPRLLWLNEQYFQDLGVALTPSYLKLLEAKIIKEFSYGLPSPGEPNNAFLSEKRLAFADRYGGFGRGGNHGSGRAATFLTMISGTLMQSKGIGRTPLVKRDTLDHTSGRMSFLEGLREALFAEIFHQELPYGANRVIAVIDRGTQSTHAFGDVFQDVIVIREDPIRPAHFMFLDRSNFKQRTLKGIEGRKKLLLQELFGQDLPKNKSTLTEDQLIRAGLFRYTTRIASQLARSYITLRVLHGAVSPSNIEVSGKFLDFGTATAYPEHTQIFVLPHSDASGTLTHARRYFLREFLNELKKELELEFKLASTDRYVKWFDLKYEEAQRTEYLKLLGYPEALASELAQTGDGRLVASILDAFALKGVKPHNGNWRRNGDATPYFRYSLRQIIPHLLIAQKKNSSQFFLTFGFDQEEELQAARLYKVFQSLQQRALTQASLQGISTSQFLSEQVAQAKNLNRNLEHLYGSHLHRSIMALYNQYLTNKDPTPVRKFINNTIDYSRKHTAPNRMCHSIFAFL